MEQQTLYRYGGIAAIVSIIAFVASMILGMTTDPLGTPTMAAYVISTLASLVTLYALYVFHRTNAAALSLAALVLAVASSLLGFGADYTDPTSPLMLLLIIAYGLAGLLYGWLGYRSSPPMRPAGVVSLVMGVVAGAAAGAVLIGTADLASNLIMLANLVWVVWFLLVARVFLTAPSRLPSAA